jgi:hypothetical protein
MGKKLRKKVAEQALQEQNFKQRIAVHSYNEKQEPAVIPLRNDIPVAYHRFFINDPDTCKIRTRSHSRMKQVMEVIKHSFNKFPVPKILEQAWFITLNQGRYNEETKIEQCNPALQLEGMAKEDFKLWYICVATGGSLYKDYVKDILTKKEVYTFLSCPFNINLKQAVIYAVAKCAGANDGMALRIAKSKISERRFISFWKDVIKFFAMNTPESIAMINDLTDYIEFKYNENRECTVLGHGFTVDSLKKKMKDWHWSMGRLKAMGHAVWTGALIPNQEFITKDEYKENVTWNFNQILDAQSLAKEGNQMRHCVYSYKDRCIRGDCSIWSLTSTDSYGHSKRRLTIELNREGRIVQVRGLANRSPHAEEYKMIETWSKQNHFIYSRNTY